MSPRSQKLKRVPAGRSLHLRIGDIPVTVQSADQDFLEILREKYQAFWGRRSQGGYALYLKTEPRLQKPEDIRVRLQGQIGIITAGEFYGKVNLQQRRAQVTVRPHESVFDTWLRVFYSVILPSHQGFLVHAAALADGLKGYVFAGPSSSGKTTVARAARTLRVLSDELVLVRCAQKRFYVFATPFCGEYSGPIKNFRARLRALCFLNKRLPCRSRALSATEVVPALLHNTFFFVDDPETNRALLKVCCVFANEVRGYQVNTRRGKQTRRIIHDIENSPAPA